VTFRNIVVAVDGSEASQEALSHAVEIARQSQAALTGVFVIDSEWPDYIGNDWQSARGARQPFLDYIREEQEQQAKAAQGQFEKAAGGLPGAQFALHAGDPSEVLIKLAQDAGTDLLVLNRKIFQISGRPSLKALHKNLAAKAQRPYLVFP
jgi:nucleotide-binding universal stress UspA family protein